MIKPLGDRVVLKVNKPESQTQGGIYIPTTEVPNQGTVVAVGPGRVFENGQVSPLEVSVGDRVIFTQFSGTQIKQGDEEYLVLHEGDIIAII